MLDIFSGLRLVVKRRSINIDNAIFRCHWFFTSTLLVSFSLIITARQYVGQPIECHSVNKLPDSLLNSYCWVQSTFSIPQACSPQHQQVGLDVPYPCIDNTRGREIKMYAYYQWVGIVLFIQGLMFHLPYYLWKLWENGLIRAITGGLRIAMLNEQERSKKKDIVVQYIHEHLGCHKRYAFKYFLCEFICLINLLGQMWATNKFFDGQFLRYGLDVIQYSSSVVSATTTTTTDGLDKAINSTSSQKANSDNNAQNIKPENSMIPNASRYAQSIKLSAARIQRNPQQQHLVDPMTYVFPRMTKCTYYDFGSSGDVQKHDALCLLPLNIINEKIYIALWFWFLILAILTLLVIIYRLFAIISENVRCKGLISRCKLSCERDIRIICRHCDVGDWFLFYMVAENLDPLIMREIVASIASKIREHLDLKKELRSLQGEQVDEEDEQEREKQRLLSKMLLKQDQYTHLSQQNSFDSQDATSFHSSSRRSSLADQVPLVKKIKKRLYNKRLWSLDLGSGELRQQMFGGQSNQQATVTNTGEAITTTLQVASAPPASQMPLGANSTQLLQRRASLSRKVSSGSSGVSSTSSSDSFVMEMSTISGSGSCLDDLDAHRLMQRTRHQAKASRWRSGRNNHHHC